MSRGLHIIFNPRGTYSFVGDVPSILCISVPASKSDVRGGRAFQDDNGELQTWKVPVFCTEAQAMDFAARLGCSVDSTPSSRDQAESMYHNPKIPG